MPRGRNKNVKTKRPSQEAAVHVAFLLCARRLRAQPPISNIDASQGHFIVSAQHSFNYVLEDNMGSSIQKLNINDDSLVKSSLQTSFFPHFY